MRRKVGGLEGKSKDKDRIEPGAGWEAGLVLVEVTLVLSRSLGSMRRLVLLT